MLSFLFRWIFSSFSSHSLSPFFISFRIYLFSLRLSLFLSYVHHVYFLSIFSFTSCAFPFSWGSQRDVVYLHLGCLTNSALVYESKCGGRGGGCCGFSANKNTPVPNGAQINFGDLTPYLTLSLPVFSLKKTPLKSLLYSFFILNLTFFQFFLPSYRFFY